MMSKYYISKCFVKGLKEKTRRYETPNHARVLLGKPNVKIISHLRKCFFNSKKSYFWRFNKIFWVGSSRIGSIG